MKNLKNHEIFFRIQSIKQNYIYHHVAMNCCITKMSRLIIIVYISQAYVDFFRILYYFSMLKLLYNATSSFERNFTEISQLQAQRRNEIRVMNDCI